jgi:hypothetical protein
MKTDTIKKILTEAKEKNLTWNFSYEGQYHYPKDTNRGKPDYDDGNDGWGNPKLRTNDIEDSIKEENLGATDDFIITFNTGEKILYTPYEEDCEVCDYSGSLTWIDKYIN